MNINSRPSFLSDFPSNFPTAAASVSVVTSLVFPSSTSQGSSTTLTTTSSPLSSLLSSTSNEDSNGLDAGTAAGIGVGAAILVILIALAAWILVRRRRKIWGKKHRGNSNGPHLHGETPNDEIAHKVEQSKRENWATLAKETNDGPVEIANGEVERVELDAGAAGKGVTKDAKRVEEEQQEAVARDPCKSEAPDELGKDKGFVAELEGSSASLQETLKPDSEGEDEGTAKSPTETTTQSPQPKQ